MADYAVSYHLDFNFLAAEAMQRREEGAEPGAVDAVMHELEARGDRPLESGHFEATYRRLSAIPQRRDWGYIEPSDLSSIRTEREPSTEPARVESRTLGERVHAAWTGRAIGCLMGKAFEGLERAAIRRYLTAHDEYPLRSYPPAPSTPTERDLLNRSWPQTVRGAIDGMVRDDDMDYTILALKVAELYGDDVRSADIARTWLLHLPYAGIYTAERMAYRNLVHDVMPPVSAQHYNPYREWIGAQIRADMWGYLSAGDPARAADYAWRDARVSHTKNGLYGEMAAAGMIAAAFGVDDPSAAVLSGLAQIPRRSRLADVMRSVLEWHDTGLTWDQAVDAIETAYCRYHWVHTLNNAALVVAALLYGNGDFATSVGMAVTGGWDTDCNGATVGSVLGAMHGPRAIPSSLRDLLHDRVSSFVIGEGDNRISALAERTLAVTRRV
ncbi:MAG: ADP-ribosylglycohydrolase family protein [Chloroflexota bacterium]